MWAVVVAPISTPFFPLTVSAKSPEPLSRNQASQTPKGQRETETKETQKGQRTKQLSGLDVLWAMQKAAAERTNKATSGAKRNNKKGRGRLLSSAGGRREEEDGGVDFSDVRPLCIRKEWGTKLVEFEKRLQDLSPSLSQNI